MSSFKNETEVWRARPDIYFKDVLGVNSLEGYQSNILKEIQENDRVVIRAAHSLGKTWMLARAALWFFSCYRNSIIISTAPTYKQVDALLWGELRDAHKNAKMNIGGKLLSTKLTKSDKWYAMGFSPQKTAGTSDEQQGSSFQGFHSDYVFIIFDEAVGCPPDLWKMSEGLMTSGKIVKFVGIANPTTRNCEFFKKFSSQRYKCLHLSCFDSPNLIANGFLNKDDLELEIERLLLLPQDERMAQIADYKKPRPPLLSAQWVVDYVMEWGFNHPLTLSKVFGEFPENDDAVLIKMSYVNDAIKREYEIDDRDTRSIGVDVARYGSDKSVLCEMVGAKQTGLIAVAKQSITVVTGHVVRMINGEHSGRKTVVMVDATGLGAGVLDNLLELQFEGTIPKNVDIREIHFGGSPVNNDETDRDIIDQDRARYTNLKAKLFQLLAIDMKNLLDIWDEANFLKELPTIKSAPDSKGRLKIESKEDYKKRTGRPSPDYADALGLCNLGRHVNIGSGSFTNLQKGGAGFIVRNTDKRKERKSKIKISSY